MIKEAIKQKAQSWLDSQAVDEASKQEIKQLMEQESPELEESFYKDLEFGTGGLRGIMGVGSNRMNKYTVGMATQGLANYLLKSFPGEEIKVAIAYDSRNNSRFFAETTAAVFSANGIRVFLFEELRPTPELSFAIRHLGCHSGVVLTASHNPKEYNGYKAYWNDGAQLITPHDKNVIEEVGKIAGIDDVKFTANDALISAIGNEVDEAYLEQVASLSLSRKAIEGQSNLKIVYSPIHGTGVTMVPRMLEKLGFTNVTVLESQSEPDGNFPTVVYPNPEEEEAMSLALARAKEIDADLVMATDPDTDRVGIAVKNHKGEWQLLNGNQTGALLVHYLITAWKKNGKLTGKQFVAKTIVTSELLDTIAAKNDVTCYNTLTGFKYIAALIKEKEGKEEYIGGGEESYGYLIGEAVRDKDAVAACALIAELTAVAREEGLSLFEKLLAIYEEYGIYREHLISITRKGMKGAEEIQEMMKDLRANPPKTINGSETVRMIDYQALVEKDLSSGAEKAVDQPKSNVLQFYLADGSKISARPSGTEPKIKFYFSVADELPSAADFDTVNDRLGARIDAIIKDMKL